MKIDISTKNYNLKENFKSIILKKIEKLSRYFNDDAKATAYLKREGDLFKLELIIQDKGLLFKSERVSDNMYENLDIVLPKIEKQIIKVSSKAKDKIKGASQIRNGEFEFIADILPVKTAKIVKTKKFDLIPLTEEEALVNYESMDHDFYIYLSKETNKVHLIYKRHDGDLAVIETNY